MCILKYADRLATAVNLLDSKLKAGEFKLILPCRPQATGRFAISAGLKREDGSLARGRQTTTPPRLRKADRGNVRHDTEALGNQGSRRGTMLRRCRRAAHVAFEKEILVPLLALVHPFSHNAS